MEKQELISVIIPVYNVEKYLAECIDSVINQTYKNIEILLIDDGSPDNSPEICDKYAKKDQRIQVVHKANGGVSSARNTGIELAKGAYITFIDSDDYIDKNFLEKLYRNLNGCYISECGTVLFDETNSIVCKTGKPIIFTWKDYLTETNLNGFLSYACVCGKLYARHLFSEIRFPVGRVNGEDEATAFKLVYKGKKVSRIYDPLYYYRQREEGASQNQISKQRIDDAEFLFNEKISFFRKQDQEDMVAFFYSKKALCFSGLWEKAENQEDKQYCMRIVVNCFQHFIKKRNVPIKYKIYITFFILKGKVI